MQAHEGESILSYLLSVPALGKTKPPSGGSQGVISTLATNKQNIKYGPLDHHLYDYLVHSLIKYSDFVA